MTKAKFKVTDDMVDAAYYGVECDLSWDEMKKIIQLAADQWLQTKGGGYVSQGDYDEVCESLVEEYGELVKEYGLVLLTEIKDKLYKRGIKL